MEEYMGSYKKLSKLRDDTELELKIIQRALMAAKAQPETAKIAIYMQNILKDLFKLYEIE